MSRREEQTAQALGTKRVHRTDRIPRHDLDQEAEILSTLMSQAILDLDAKGEDTEPPDVISELRARDVLGKVGGAEYVKQIEGNPARIGPVFRKCVASIIDLALLRQTRKCATAMLNRRALVKVGGVSVQEGPAMRPTPGPLPRCPRCPRCPATPLPRCPPL